MMMTAPAAYTTTAYDATTTSGLGNGSRSKSRVNIGLKRISNEFEMTKGIFMTDWINQSKPTKANLFYFYVFSTIWLKFGMWTANAHSLLLLLPCSCIAAGLLLVCSQPAPGLLMVCSCPTPDPAHPSLAAFIIIIISA